MSSINGHCELLHSSPSVSGGGYRSGTEGRQHAPFLSIVPDSRYITMREVMDRFPGDAALLEKAEQALRNFDRCLRNKVCTRKRRARRKTAS